MEECRGALNKRSPSLAPNSAQAQYSEMQLNAALGASSCIREAQYPRCADRCVLRNLPVQLGDTTVQLIGALGSVFLLFISRRHLTELGACPKVLQRRGRPDGPGKFARWGDCIVGTSLHYLGDQVNARHHIERTACSTPSIDCAPDRFQSTSRRVVRRILADVLWLQGFPDRLTLTAQTSVDGARASGHALSLCNALAQTACPIAHFVGDLAAAKNFAVMLIEHAERHSLEVWQIWGRCWKGVLLIRCGDVVGLSLLRLALDELRRTGYVLRYTRILGGRLAALGGVGQVGEGLVMIGEALARSEHGKGRWKTAELLRVKGELRLLEGVPNAPAAAEVHFQQALVVIFKQIVPSGFHSLPRIEASR